MKSFKKILAVILAVFALACTMIVCVNAAEIKNVNVIAWGLDSQSINFAIGSTDFQNAKISPDAVVEVYYRGQDYSLNEMVGSVKAENMKTSEIYVSGYNDYYTCLQVTPVFNLERTGYYTMLVKEGSLISEGGEYTSAEFSKDNNVIRPVEYVVSSSGKINYVDVDFRYIESGEKGIYLVFADLNENFLKKIIRGKSIKVYSSDTELTLNEMSAAIINGTAKYEGEIPKKNIMVIEDYDTLGWYAYSNALRLTPTFAFEKNRYYFFEIEEGTMSTIVENRMNAYEVFGSIKFDEDTSFKLTFMDRIRSFFYFVFFILF